MNNILSMIQGIKRGEDAERKLLDIQDRLNMLSKSIGKIKLPKYSGWHVLLKDDKESPSGYKFVGFFNPEQCEEDGSDEPEWSLSIPIWDINSIPEFMGW